MIISSELPLHQIFLFLCSLLVCDGPSIALQTICFLLFIDLLSLSWQLVAVLLGAFPLCGRPLPAPFWAPGLW
jgi:hypothetical protein